jgi:hemerythrin superfamily protein
MADKKNTQPMESILTLIESDHEAVEQLFEDIEEAEKPKEIQSYFEEIYKELTLHAHAEEIVFYPAMMEYEETREYVEEAEAEHNSAKILLEQMKQLGASHPEFATKMTHLKETILHHVEEEENELFEAVEKCMDKEKLSQLGMEFQQAKANYKPSLEAAMAARS